MNRKRIISTWLILIVLLMSWSLPATANFPGNLQKQDEYYFNVPPGLETQVEFWKNIYTEYTTHHAVIHDATDLSIIYEVVYLGDRTLSSRARNKKVNPVVYKYKRILRKLARKKKRKNLDYESQRIVKLVKDNFHRASRNIRVQLGQSDRFQGGLIRSGRYMPEIRKAFREIGVPEELTALPHVESSFQVNAYSSAGAAGVWQFTRRTGRRFMKIGYAIDERLDPVLSARAAAKLLKYNYEQVRSWPLAITAYNHGINGMKRAKRKFGDDIVKISRHYRSRTFGFASRNFFAEFLAALEVSQNPEKYFPKLNLEQPIKVAKVRIKDYVHIDTMSEFLGMSRKEIASYNPALRRPVIHGKKRIPRGFVFQAPEEQYPNITSLYDSIPNNFKYRKQVKSRWYTVRRGDTLSTIARRMGTSIRKLKMINNIGRRNRIYKGQVLEMPGWSKGPRKGVKIVAAKPDLKKYKVGNDGSINYRVRRYDNLTKIAKKFDVPVNVLAQFNSMLNPHQMHPGDYIKIPKAEGDSPVVTAALQQPVGNPLKAQVAKLPAEATETPVMAPKMEMAQLPIEVKELPANPKNEENPETVASVPEKTVVMANIVSEPDMFNKNRPAFTPVKIINAEDYDYPIGVIKVDFDETLSHIADWTRVSIREIRRLNHLRRRSIRIRQTIKIPFRRVSAADFEQSRQEYHKAIQEDFFNNYRVEKVVVRNLKRGETLWEICNHIYTIPLWLLNNYNPEKKLNSLAEGEPIKIPVISEIKAS